MGFFSKGLKYEFETAVVDKPSVFEPLKVYCIAVFGNPIAIHSTIYHLHQSLLKICLVSPFLTEIEGQSDI